MMNFRILSPLVRQYRLATPSSSSSIQRTSSSRWKCFFGVAADGTITFCGCDRDTLRANGCPLYHARGKTRWAVLDTTLPHPDGRNDEDNRVSKGQLGANKPTRR